MAAARLAPSTCSLSPKAVRVIIRCTAITARMASSNPPWTVVPKSRGSRSSTARLRVCGTVVSGSRSTSLIKTFAKLVPRKLIIKVVMISFTP